MNMTAADDRTVEPLMSAVEENERIKPNARRHSSFDMRIMGVGTRADNSRSLVMGREFCKFKTGLTESQKADSARADSPGILTFFS